MGFSKINGFWKKEKRERGSRTPKKEERQMWPLFRARINPVSNIPDI
jgi:hypothetical protein